MWRWHGRGSRLRRSSRSCVKPKCGSHKGRRRAKSAEVRGSRSRPTTNGDVSTVAEDRPGQTVEGTRAGERAAEEGCFGANARQANPQGSFIGKILSPSRKRACVEHVRSQLTVSERRACAVVGQSRTTQRRQPKVRADEAALTDAIVRMATRYGRYGTGAFAACCSTRAGT